MVIPISDLTIEWVQDMHRLKSKENSNIVLLSQSMNDSNDPLNWFFWKKVVVILSILWFSGMKDWIVDAISSIIVIIDKEFDKNLMNIVKGVINWFVLLLDVGV